MLTLGSVYLSADGIVASIELVCGTRGWILGMVLVVFNFYSMEGRGPLYAKKKNQQVFARVRYTKDNERRFMKG